MEEYEGALGVVFRRKAEIEFLIIHNKKSGNKTFPAGGRNEGEISSLVTVSREVKEETGYDAPDYTIKSTGIVQTFTYGLNKKERAGQMTRQPVYLIEIISDKEAHPLDSNAIIDGWYDYNTARERLTFDDSKELLDRIMDLIK